MNHFSSTILNQTKANQTKFNELETETDIMNDQDERVIFSLTCQCRRIRELGRERERVY